MDVQRFDEAIQLAVEAFASGHKGNFMEAVDYAQAAIPGYYRSCWLLDCAINVFDHPEAIEILNIVRENLLLLPPEAI